MAEPLFDTEEFDESSNTTSPVKTPFGIDFYRTGFYSEVEDSFESFQSGWHGVTQFDVQTFTNPSESEGAQTERDDANTSLEDRGDFSVDFYLTLLRKSKPHSFVEPMIERVEELRQLAAEEGPGQNAPNSNSLKGFFRFIYTNRTRIKRRPRLVLTYEGNLRAEWKKRFNDRAVVEFLNPIDLKFVLMRPNVAHRTRINRSSGSSTVDTFFQDLGIDEL